jgi:hypothetical protein
MLQGLSDCMGGCRKERKLITGSIEKVEGG